MTFVVTDVSRGDIHLASDAHTARVLGEGLLVSKDGDPAFVVYRDSISEIESHGRVERASDAVRHEIVEAIGRYFAERGMKVEFA